MGERGKRKVTPANTPASDRSRAVSVRGVFSVWELVAQSAAALALRDVDGPTMTPDCCTHP